VSGAAGKTALPSTWHVYMVRAANGSLYTGVATDVGRRFEEHAASRGRGAKSLRGRGPLQLAFRKRIGDRALALKVECAIKRLPKREKERLVDTRPGGRRLLRLLAIAPGASASNAERLQVIPGVGPSVARDLEELGVHEVADLQGRDPEAMYRALCAHQGVRVDRCMLYVFRCAVYYADHTRHDPERLKWWNWKDSRS